MRFVYQSGTPMQPVFLAAKHAPKRVAYAEGEDERVLRAAQAAVDEGIARPVLVGRGEIILSRVEKLGLRLAPGGNCDIVNTLDDPRYREYGQEYYMMMRREGVSRAQAMDDMRGKPTLIAAMLLRKGDADAMLCGTRGNHADHLPIVRDVIGLREGATTMAAMQMLILPGRQLFICDTHVNRDPDAGAIAEMTLLAVEEVQRFGVKPSVALLSHSSFGSSTAASARKMRDALAMITAKAPDLEVEGEMRADSALSKRIRDNEFPESRLSADANLLIMPNIDAANITNNALRVTSGGGITVGGILLGAAKPAHLMTPSSTVRRVLNMTAVAVADAGAKR
jgi:malate dehydrogenase (oxaloacetate-decarboxylating)(NADP+)